MADQTQINLAQTFAEILTELKRLRRAMLLNAKATLTAGNTQVSPVTLAEVDTALQEK